MSSEKNQTNVVSEIDESNGIAVPLGQVKLPKIGEEEDLLSSSWSSPVKKINSPENNFETGITAGYAATSDPDKNLDGDREENEPTKRTISDKKEIASDTSRNRIDQAMKGEPKKGTNPRLIGLGVGALVVIVVLCFVFISMSGEKRKSLLGKNKQADNTNEQVANDTARTQSSSTGSGESDRRTEGLKFGDVSVGNDPKSTQSNNTSNPESTEEARKTENVDPAISPTPTPTSSYPFTPGYVNYPSTYSSGGQNPSVASPNNSDSTSGKNQTNAKNNKNDLADSSLGMETEEDRFRVVLRAGQNDSRKNTEQETQNNAAAENNNQTDSSLTRGTRLELILDEPIRSGIATAVTGKVKKGIANKNGEVIIPKDSMAVIQFSAEVANGRVFNDKQSPVQIVTPDGRSFEVKGVVKDAQGFAGLTGKITNVGGRSALSKIGGVLGRVGTALPGGTLITGAQQGIEAGSSDYVTNASQIVVVPRGTSFMLIVGF